MDRLKRVKCIDGDLHIGISAPNGGKRKSKVPLTLKDTGAFDSLEYVSGEIAIMDTAFADEVEFENLRFAGSIRYCSGKSRRRCIKKLPTPIFAFPELLKAKILMVGIERLSVPVLQTAETIQLRRISGEYVFPRLFTAGAIKMNGIHFSAAFPELRTVARGVEIRSESEKASSWISLPRLKQAASLRIIFSPPNCDKLNAFLPSLESVEGKFDIQVHPKTSGCWMQFPSLRQTGDFKLIVPVKERVWSFAAPQLKSAHFLSLKKGIATLMAPSLTTVKSLYISCMPFEVADFPSLRNADSFTLAQVKHLRSLQIPELEVVDKFEFSNQTGDFRIPGVVYGPSPAIEIGLKTIKKKGVINDVRRLRDWPLPALESAADLHVTDNLNLEPLSSAQFQSFSSDHISCGNRGELPCRWLRPLAKIMGRVERPFPSKKERRRKKTSNRLAKLADTDGGAFHVDLLSKYRPAKNNPASAIFNIAFLSDPRSGELDRVMAMGLKGPLFEARPTSKTSDWKVYSSSTRMYIVLPVPPKSRFERSYEVFQLEQDRFERLPDLHLGAIAKDRAIVGLEPSDIDLSEEYIDHDGNSFHSTEYNELRARAANKMILRFTFAPPRLDERKRDRRLPIVVRLVDNEWIADESLATAYPPTAPFQPSAAAQLAAEFAMVNRKPPRAANDLPDASFRIAGCLSAVPRVVCASRTKRARNSPLTKAHCWDRKRKIDGDYVEWYPSKCAGTGAPAAESIKGFDREYRRVNREGAAAVRMRTTYRHGVEVGPRYRYTPNGSLLSVARFNAKGLRHGWSQDYNPSRTRNEGKGLYFEGRKIGEWNYPLKIQRFFGFGTEVIDSPAYRKLDPP